VSHVVNTFPKCVPSDLPSLYNNSNTGMDNDDERTGGGAGALEAGARGDILT
jgi:hypothetical protein